MFGKSLKDQADLLLSKYGDTIPAKELNKVRQQFDSLVNYTEKSRKSRQIWCKQAQCKCYTRDTTASC